MRDLLRDLDDTSCSSAPTDRVDPLANRMRTIARPTPAGATVAPEPQPPERNPHEPPVPARRRQAERHAPAGGALFVAGISAWGNLKQELLPDIEFPVITVVAPLPGRRRGRRRRAGGQADRAGDLGRAAARGPPVDVGQLDRARRRPVLVRHRRQGDRRPRSSRTCEPRGCRRRSTPKVTALNINASPVDHRLDRGHQSEDGLDRASRRSPRTRSCPAIHRIDGVATRRPHGRRSSRGSRSRSTPTKLAEAGVSVQQISGVLQANNLTVPVRPARRATARRSRCRRSASIDVGRRRSQDLVVGVRPAGRTGRPRTRGAAPAPDAAASASRASPVARGTRPPRRRSRSATSARSSSRASPRPAMPDQRQARAVAVRHQDLRRQHRRWSREAVEAALDEIAGAARRRPDRHDRLRPVRLHHRVAGRAAARGRPGRAVRGPHDLPVPVQPALDAGRRDQHPALGPDRARDDAGRPASP